MVAALQDPRKDVLTIRNLFPDRIAMRLDEPEQVDMVLGDGARDRGATCELISPDPATGAGVAFVRLEADPDPVRVRAGWVTDCGHPRPGRPVHPGSGRVAGGGGVSTFYLGTHQPHWLRTAGFPLFVSHRQLARRRGPLRPAACRWALDSGGFTELSLHGRWVTPAAAYADAADRYSRQLGRLDFAAPQDWMCEPAILARTGLTVREHQDRTVASYLELRALAPHLPFIPVVQGWHLADYLACVELYRSAGVDLARVPLTGLGSVCRRQSTGQIAVIVTTLACLGLRLHGFGIKTTGLHLYGHLLASADSMAWSYAARRAPALPGCTGHRNCANCLTYATRWRDRILTATAARGCQASLFDPEPLEVAA